VFTCTYEYVVFLSIPVTKDTLQIFTWHTVCHSHFTDDHVAQLSKYLYVQVCRKWVGIVTHYGLDGPGIESCWGRDFTHLSRLSLEPTQSPPQWLVCPFPRGKAAGTWRWQPTPSSVEINESVEMYLCFTCGPTEPCLGWTFTCM
jgi:hypothetical protein